MSCSNNGSEGADYQPSRYALILPYLGGIADARALIQADVIADDASFWDKTLTRMGSGTGKTIPVIPARNFAESSGKNRVMNGNRTRDDSWNQRK